VVLNWGLSSKFQGFGVSPMPGSFCALTEWITKFWRNHISFFQLRKVRRMHGWNLRNSVPPAKLKTTDLEHNKTFTMHSNWTGFGMTNLAFFQDSQAWGRSCDQQIQVPSGATGVITSPGYPGQYPARNRCTYQIATASSSGHVTITFDSFSIEGHRTCS